MATTKEFTPAKNEEFIIPKKEEFIVAKKGKFTTTKIRFIMLSGFVNVFEKELQKLAKEIKPDPGNVNGHPKKKTSHYNTYALWDKSSKQLFWGYWQKHFRLGNIIKREIGGFNDI